MSGRERSTDREFDVVVIGAGPAGEHCAGRLAEAGLEVAMVEQGLVGGECSYYACMPSKSLLRAGQVLAETRRVPGSAEAIHGSLDVAAALARRDEVIHGLDDSSHLPWLRERSIALVRGHGRLAGEREVKVGEMLLRARRAVVLAAGSAAAVPPIPGLREAAPWTNRQATTSEHVPESLLVLGGGVVGVEMAWAYASMGARVTIVEAGPRLIAGEEEFASELLARGLREIGVDLRLGVEASAVSRESPGGPVTLELAGGARAEGAELLVAVGRRALSEELGLETVGLSPDDGYVQVEDTMRVPGHPWLYALGDLNGRALLTHVGKYQARIAALGILGREIPPGPAETVVPRVIFTEPQVAAVGHTLASARKAGLQVRMVDRSLQDLAGSSFIGHGAGGRAAIVIEQRREVIVGATFVGVEVAESLHAATIAIVGELPLARLAHAIPSFPTRSEIWLELLAAAAAE